MAVAIPTIGLVYEHPAITKQRLRQSLCALIDKLVTALDHIDGDPDLEDGADDEPSLSFANIWDQDLSIQVELTGSAECIDLEEACEDEGGEHDGREPDADDEPFLVPNLAQATA